MRPFGKTWKTYFSNIKDDLGQDLVHTGFLSLIILSLEIVGGLFLINLIFDGFDSAVAGAIGFLSDKVSFLMFLLQPVLLFSICTIIIRRDVLKGKPRTETTGNFIAISSLRFIYILPLAYYMGNISIGGGIVTLYMELIWSFVLTPVALLIAYRTTNKAKNELTSLLS